MKPVDAEPKGIARERQELDLRLPLVKPSEDLDESILRSAMSRTSPTRQAVLRRTIGLTSASWLIALVVFVYAGGPRVLGRPWSLVVGTVLGIAAAAGVAAWAALGRGRSPLGRARRLLVPVVIGAPAVIFAWKVFWSAQYEDALDDWPTRPGFRCLALSLSLAVCPFISFVIARRGSDPRRPVFTGFAAGIAIGCITSLLTDLWCPVAYVPHLLLGHLLPIVLLGALGAWLGRRNRSRPSQVL